MPHSRKKPHAGVIYNKNENYVFFHSGWPSQWFPCDFIVDGIPYNCCEQWMMAGKAKTFKDDVRLRQILQYSHPRDQKAAGRKVRKFNSKTWNSVKEDVVFEGNFHRFSQNPRDLKWLLDTGDRMLVEASPNDRIWGIGMSHKDPRITDESCWRGLNLLGKALMRVRDELNRLKAIADSDVVQDLCFGLSSGSAFVTFVRKIIDKIRKNPDNEKFQKISIQALKKKCRKKQWAGDTLVQVLIEAGFQTQNSGGEEYLVFTGMAQAEDFLQAVDLAPMFQKAEYSQFNGFR